MDLVAENLVFRPENEYHLNNVSFTMTRGKLYTILGRTLAGKTTLLKTIAGLIAPDSGSITYSGKEFGSLPVWKRNVAMVYQQFINYPHLTVFDNVAFPLKQRKVSTATFNKRFHRLFSRLAYKDLKKEKSRLSLVDNSSVLRLRVPWLKKLSCCCSMSHSSIWITSSENSCGMSFEVSSTQD